MSELIDNRAHRVRKLKTIIGKLHQGESPASVKAELREIVQATDYTEIIAMEQELMSDGMPVEEIRSMCDLHSQLTREVLVQLPARAVPPGHPVDTFRRENEALRETLRQMRQAMQAVSALPEDAVPDQPLLSWRQAFNELMDVEKHYQRKEHTLFSKLETHGITGPSKVMWAKHDDARALLKDMARALREKEATAGEWKLVASTLGETTLAAVEEMIYKEENILFPMALDTLTEEDWAAIWLASPAYGWCLVEPRDEYRPPDSVVRQGLKLAQSEAVHLPTGNLTLEQLIAVFKTLPVDITFVDDEDRVAFFSEGPSRVFARSKAIIGRKVQHCHPPKSVDTVDRILNDFRSGRQSVAEFWLSFQGRFVDVRYFALRENGRYLGTLEVTQDLTRLRQLEGERRLLEYDEPAQDPQQAAGGTKQ